MAWHMRSTRSVGASADVVYGYYTDPSTWGRWAHNTRAARVAHSVEDGSAVEVQDGFGHWWTVQATAVEAGRRITYVNQLPGVTITSSYDVQPTPGGCTIDHRIEMRGRAELAYRPLQPLYGHLLKLETERLRSLAERGAPLADGQSA
jgi:uncharacterized protein YndB with AHSA1/START domain